MVEHDERRYVFVGNREYVLKEMLRKGLHIAEIWVMENSFLHRTLMEDPFAQYRVISNKDQLLKQIKTTDFDILISNGCKYVLPISQLKKAKYINIHPSFLPDLKGKDPINAACLYERDCGASCHEMDDGIDTGKIIARIRIPMSEDIEAALLYQLCFKAEVMAFQEAYTKDFETVPVQPDKEDAIYFSMRPSDWLVKFESGFSYVLRQAKAFGYRSKGLYFKINGQIFHFYKASEITNPFVKSCCDDLQNMQIGFVFENSIIFKFEERIMRFDQVEYIPGQICEGDFVLPCREEDIAFS